MFYRCAHCLAILAPVVDGEPVPVCHDHPDGQIDIIAGDDTE